MTSKTAEISIEDFYADVLSEADRARLETARGMENVDEEIAILRIKLRDQLMRHPHRMHLFNKSLDTLTKVVSTRYKLSPKSTDDLNESIAGVINGIGRELWPEGMP